ncbi:hypothetical protein EV424DRAFT_1343223 [Suillus variegatus]|nr:hypothetical protein EV424DRAFT_1343223 [Suillus variegatus]
MSDDFTSSVWVNSSCVRPAIVSHLPTTGCPYASHLAFLQNGMNQFPVIPEDWALHTTHIASEWVEQQFLAHVAGRLLVDPPPGLDCPTLLSCGHLAFLMAEAYQHPIKLNIDIIRYNKAFAKRKSGMNDAQEEALLAKFPPAEKIVLDSPSVMIDSGCFDSMGATIERYVHGYTIHGGPAQDQYHHWENGCINIAPCWFQQGRECYGPPPKNPEDGFKPKISATLKGYRSSDIIVAMQQPA